MNVKHIADRIGYSEAEVSEFLAARNIKLETVTEGMLNDIRREMKSFLTQSAISPTVQPTTSDRALSRPVQPNQPKGNGLSTRVNKRGAALDKKVTANNDDRRGADNSLVTFARGVDQKIADHSEQATAAITGIAVHRANEVVSALKEAPKVYFQTIQEGLEDGIDHDSFREASAEFEQQLLEHFPWLGETA